MLRRIAQTPPASREEAGGQPGGVAAHAAPAGRS
jgi:hypothetical protein